MTARARRAQLARRLGEAEGRTRARACGENCPYRGVISVRSEPADWETCPECGKTVELHTVAVLGPGADLEAI